MPNAYTKPKHRALATWLKGMQMSKKELAEKAGISLMTLSHYLHGRRKPTGDNLAALVKATGLPESTILGG